ncbi:hypothetical protein lerEdw1_015902 [Lerista edwardsae]|nr:hypothetical protein lerEdw1_015902 [Lerista edwardsae]
MKGALWSVVAAFMIVLQAAADIPIQPNVDIPKLAGKWNGIAVVVDCGDVKSTLRYYIKVVVEKNGVVIVTRIFPKKKHCKETKVHLKPTDQPGKLITDPLSSTLRVVDTDYDGYSIFHIETHLRNELYLFARNRKVSNAVKEKFKRVTAALGFEKNRIVYRTKHGSCPR